MLLIIGFLVVVGATIGGFMFAGGKLGVLIQVSEFITIGGIAVGILLISSPASVLKSLMAKIMTAMKNNAGNREDYLDLLKALYELFMQARRGGMIAIEDHVMNPKQSTILSKYTSLVESPARVEFLCNSLKPVIDGRIKPEQLESLLQTDVDAKETEADHPVHLLQLIGDSLPGVGIVAAVLGIINTMAAIAEGPEKVGHHVAAALTGTFLGVLGAYGFINPLASRIKSNNALDVQYYSAILKGITSFTGGMAPLMAVEVARRCLDHTMQPSAEELEELLKNVGSGAPASS